jgi:hypothetical protein
MVLPALKHGKYNYRLRVKVGERLGGGKHFVDVVAEKDNRQCLISMKWQQVAGTAEQKVPFEIICLAGAVEHGDFEKAYLVLGGEGWRLREFYTSGGLSGYLTNANLVEIVTLKAFVARANHGEL